MRTDANSCIGAGGSSVEKSTVGNLKPLQVYAATLAELVRDVTERRGAKSALISRTTGRATYACGGESRCEIRSVKQRRRKKLKELINYGREF